MITPVFEDFSEDVLRWILGGMQSCYTSANNINIGTSSKSMINSMD